MISVRPYLSSVLEAMPVRRTGAPLRLLLSAAAAVFASAAAAVPCPEQQAAIDASLQRIYNEWPLRASSDHPSRYVQNLASRLAADSGRPELMHWKVALVRNLAPNAFSIGNGYAFVTDGALRFVLNESELAAILAHELGHELAGHFCAPKTTTGSGGLFDLFSRPEPEPNRIGVGSLTQVIDPSKEREADDIALSLLWSAGFNPRALLDMALRLPANCPLHYLNAERVRFLERAVLRFPPAKAVSSNEFFAVKRSLETE